jgi:hypothetical protein
LARTLGAALALGVVAVAGGVSGGSFMSRLLWIFAVVALGHCGRLLFEAGDF